MLLERCQRLRDQITKHNALRRAHQDAEAFRERAAELRRIRESLSGALEKADVLRTKGVAVGGLQDPAGVVSALRDYEKTLAEGSENGRHFVRLKRTMEKLSAQAIAESEEALESVKRDLPSIEESFLKQVENIPTCVEQVMRIRREREGLFNGVALHSMSPEELGRFLDRRDALRRLADELRPAEFPKEVIDFFKAARRGGGAPLEKLTETVRQWLAERDQLKNIRITVAG